MKQICKAIINWILFLTLPVWGGVFIMGMMIHEEYRKPDSTRIRECLEGEKWIIEI